jgi:transcriptional regulator GlxA family with amidase domain
MDVRVTAVIQFMNGSLGEPLSIQTLSKHVNLSPSRLRQLFNAEVGLSPMQYLRDLRMRQAQQLLANSFLTIKEVTFRCGFGDVSHFAQDFKKQVGLTPSEFREVRRNCLSTFNEIGE